MMENVPSGEEGGQRGEEDDEKEEEVHFGVGCDLCGSYPIKGERYQCRDCKEDENGCHLVLICAVSVKNSTRKSD